MFNQIRPALAALVCILLTSFATGSACAASKTSDKADPIYQSLDGVDLSNFKSAGDGLLLIASTSDRDILLTEPGHPYKLPEMDWSGLGDEDASVYDSYYEGKNDRNPATGRMVEEQFSGYMIRWKGRTSDPVPHIGRVTVRKENGSVVTYSGSFRAFIFKSKKTRNGGAFLEGISEARDFSGKLIWKRYRINHYWVNYGHIFTDLGTESALTDREIKSRVGTHASGLPQFEFVLPRPETITSKPQSKDRSLFTRAYSLADLLRQKKISADHLLLKPFAPIKERDNFDEQKDTLHIHSWVAHGQSAFLYSAKTGKTYLVPYNQDAPVLTLPSLKDIVLNGELSVNRQCMGKTDGTVVLSGQCDPAAPVFPLTVMTQVSDSQYVINVWSDINHRSSYLLTGGQFPKEDFYRWKIDAFMVDKAVDPAATRTALATGKDPISGQMIAFTSQSRLKPYGASPVASKTAGELYPMYRLLQDVDLSKYSSADHGLLLIAQKGDYDILLTEPGHPYEMRAMKWGGIYRSDSARTKTPYSGYLVRNRKNGGGPVPYIGRQTFVALDGSVQSYYGSFNADSFKRCLLCHREYVAVFIEGYAELKDASGEMHPKPYRINRYWQFWYQFHSGNHEWDYYARPEDTNRKIRISPASQDEDQEAAYTKASGLPQFEFVLPKPEQVVAEFSSTPHRALFMRAYSLADLLRQKKINPAHLLLKPFAPAKFETNFDEERNLHRHDHAWVRRGQSALLYSAKTGKTYLVPYNQDSPVLTLPSLKDIVLNGELSANRQCMGKTDGVVVLTGQCDPAAPVFPLTVMTQVSDSQYVINVWSDINRRSSYLLTGGQFPKQDFYRWKIDAFMVDKAVDPTATLTALATGKDPISGQMIAFASQSQDQQLCHKMTTAVSNAEEALKFDPHIEDRLAKYERSYKRDWAEIGRAISEINRNSYHTPTADFENYVWNDLAKMKKDMGQRLDALKRYKDTSNSVCQPDPQRMDALVTALSGFKQDLAASMKQLDDAYYQPAIERTKKIRYWAGRVEEAKRQYNQQVAMSQFLSNMQASLRADQAARQAQSQSIRRSMIASQQAVDAQIADVKARNQAYFANSKPVVGAAQTKMIAPVAMPSQSLDTTAHTKVYVGGQLPNRLGFQGAIAQAQAKTDRLANPRSTIIAGSQVGAGTATPAPGTSPPADGPGGAAVCVAKERNANNTPTDVAYYYAYDPHITSFKAEHLARQKYAAAHSGAPHCIRNHENQVGALVVIEWDGKDDKGAPIRLYGLGFGTSTDMAERDAVNELKTNRNWLLTSKMSYRIVYAKQY